MLWRAARHKYVYARMHVSGATAHGAIENMTSRGRSACVYSVHMLLIAVAKICHEIIGKLGASRSRQLANR